LPLLGVLTSVLPEIVCTHLSPASLAHTFSPFNGLFGNFLNFFIPVLIFALIAPAIAGLGRRAGKWLGIVAGIAYASTVLSGLIADGAGQALYALMLADHANSSEIERDAGTLGPDLRLEVSPRFKTL